MSIALIEVHDALFGYNKTPVVHARALRLASSQCLGIFGSNGSGKTTLIRGITGLLKPLTGAVSRLPGLRIGYLPQHRSLDLHWIMTAYDAAALATSSHKLLGWIGGSKTHIRTAMDKLGVADLAHKPFAKLSGGQQQRVLLAGALAADPQLLVLDEPTDGLDLQSQSLLIAALKNQLAAGLAVIIISHDIEDLLALAGSVAILHPRKTPADPSTTELIPAADLPQHVLHVKASA